MNDKVLTIAIMLSFVLIGVNGFLLMASENLYDTQGQPLQIYYGMETGGYGDQVRTDADGIEIGSDVSISSDLPSQQQGLIIAQRDNTPLGLAATTDLAKIVFGVELVMLKFSEMFPVLSPIINVFVLFAAALKTFVTAYLTSLLVRGILGRIT